MRKFIIVFFFMTALAFQESLSSKEDKRQEHEEPKGVSPTPSRSPPQQRPSQRPAPQQPAVQPGRVSPMPSRSSPQPRPSQRPVPRQRVVQPGQVSPTPSRSTPQLNPSQRPAPGQRAGQPGRARTQPSRHERRREATPSQSISVPSRRREQAAPSFTPRSPSMSRDFRRSQRPSANSSQLRLDQPNREAIERQVQQFKQRRKREPAHIHESSEDSLRSQEKRHAEAVHKTGSHIRNRYPKYRNWFNKDFFDEHYHHHLGYWNTHADWWRGAPWGYVNRWLGWGGAIFPIYYNVYGYPIQITEVDIDVNYNPNDTLALTNAGDWLPLGVFAVGSDEFDASFSNIFIQLAVNRQGEIAGTYYNPVTDFSYPIQGFLDPETQEVFLSIGSSSQIMTTGIYNLTQDVVYVQVSSFENETEIWTLVRVSD